MKVSLIDPSLFTWPYDYRLAMGLTQIGHAVEIVGSHTKTEVAAEHNQLLRKHFYPLMRSQFAKSLPHKIQLFLKGLSHIESVGRLVRHFRETRPDIIHFQWVPLPFVDSRFLSSFRAIAPTVLTVHDSNPFNDNPSSRLQRIGALEILHQFDHLIVHTAVARERLVTKGIPLDRISIVPHGLLTDHIDSQQGPHRSPVRILLFGQVKPYKGVDVLLRAISMLPADIRAACRVKVVGKPDMAMAPLFSMASELQVQQHIEFDLRFVPDSEVASLVASADIFVFPYRQIDASGVLMLAIAGGRPIVASNIGIFAEWLGPQGVGTLVQPDNPAELAHALLPLIRDPDWRQSEAQKVLELRDSVPSWRSIAGFTEAVYKRTISSRSQGGTF